MPDLFAYGTLMVPEILNAVCGCRRSGEPALLHGYRRRRVIGADYPAIRPWAGETVEGLLYTGLSDDQTDMLDAFEGSMYQRREVEISVAAGKQDAQTYVLAARYASLLSNQHWSLKQFLSDHVQEFIRRYPGFLAIDSEQVGDGPQ